ncbi:hypothetical protein CGRA01v4_04737 [Colletotrichum graminicola]|nr:hypothetical protein CGRA01v4_04737 [Colletotrichum graminicola]
MKGFTKCYESFCMGSRQTCPPWHLAFFLDNFLFRLVCQALYLCALSGNDLRHLWATAKSAILACLFLHGFVTPQLLQRFLSWAGRTIVMCDGVGVRVLGYYVV